MTFVPCTNCGQCCREALCQIAEEAGVKEVPCFMLMESEEEEGKWLCGFYAALPPGRDKRIAGAFLGIGRGCTNSVKRGLVSEEAIPLPQNTRSRPGEKLGAPGAGVSCLLSPFDVGA